ncbi:hypothetical protein L3D22_03070 [Lysobacter soli]|uniref:hypothetical protein n=1 Tax=Lysobacter TaxID=68 RepID=UPI00178BAF72|nr:hypothetical protein [Lysobacter soli]UTA54848.1 hypothetical protein L3D22_03070 [Lysobacter soli]
MTHLTVIPAKAGIHLDLAVAGCRLPLPSLLLLLVIPAKAGIQGRFMLSLVTFEEQRRITSQASDRLRRSGHFSLLAQRKVTKRKGLPFAQINPTTGKRVGAFAIRHPWLSAHRRTSCAAPFGASNVEGCSTATATATAVATANGFQLSPE